MKKTILIALSLLVASMGFAQKPQRLKSQEDRQHKHGAREHGPGKHAEFGFMRSSLLKEIGVDDATIEKIKTLMQDMRKETLSSQTEIKKKHLELRKELLEKNLNEGKIKTLITEQAELRKQQLIEVEIKKLELIKLLTPEQRDSLFKELEKERKNFFKRDQDQKNKKRSFHKRDDQKRRTFQQHKKHHTRAFYEK